LDIIELAIQGIRKFGTALKFNIKDGYNVFFGPSECGKTTLFEVIIALLDKKFSEEKGRTFIPWDSVGFPSRAGLVFKVGADTLRIIKDFASATTTLSRSTGGGNYEPLSRDPDWIHDHLSNTLGLPSGDVLKSLLLTSAMEYERQHAFEKPQELPLLTETEVVDEEQENNYELADKVYYQSAGNYDEEEAIKKRIEALQEELILIEQVQQIQFQVDGLEQEKFKIETKLKDVKVIDEKIQAINNELNKLKDVEALPEGIEQKVKSLKEQEEAKNRELMTLQKELQFARQELNKLRGTPFYKQKTFIAGISSFLPFIIAQFVLTIATDNPVLTGIAKYLPIVWITGVGVLFYSIWNEISRREKEKRAQKRLNDAQERIKTVEKKYEVEALLLRNLLQQAHLSSSEDLMDALEKIKMLKEEKKELESKKKELQEKYNLNALLKQLEELKNKIKENEERLQTVGGFSNDPNEIRKEIERLKSLLAPQSPKTNPKKQSTPKPVARESKIQAPSISGTPASPLKHLNKLASEFMKKSESEIFSSTEELLTKNISQLSGGTHTGLRMKDDGEIVSVTKGGRELYWNELSPSSKELVYLTLKLTLLEKIAEFNPLPVVLDEPIILSDDTRIIEFAKLIRKLSEKTKVIHLTSKPIFAKAGTQVYNLKGL